MPASLPDYEHIRVEIDGPVGILTMAEPKKLNAMDIPLLEDMLDAICRLNNDDAIRVGILTGEGRSFCAGADLKMKPLEGRTTRDHLNQDHRPVLMAIIDASMPWISAVNGAAAGIGSAYAMSCDLTVMAEDAYIYQAFAAIGLVPDGGATFHLTNTLGRKRAFEIIATGEKVEASKCLEWGLCNRVVAPDRLMAEARELAHSLAGRAPLALRHAKQVVHAAAAGDLAGTYDREVEAQMICTASEDAREGARAFLERRKPEWKGR